MVATRQCGGGTQRTVRESVPIGVQAEAGSSEAVGTRAIATMLKPVPEIAVISVYMETQASLVWKAMPAVLGRAGSLLKPWMSCSAQQTTSINQSELWAAWCQVGHSPFDVVSQRRWLQRASNAEL